jgi:hypothetical protein
LRGKFEERNCAKYDTVGGTNFTSKLLLTLTFNRPPISRTNNKTLNLEGNLRREIVLNMILLTNFTSKLAAATHTFDLDLNSFEETLTSFVLL